jgi:hypothetical protein
VQHAISQEMVAEKQAAAREPQEPAEFSSETEYT